FFRGAQVELDAPVLAFSLLATAVAMLAFGLVPALLAGRRRLGVSLQGASARATAGRGSRRLLAASVVAQVALALVLTFGAGLLVRSFVQLTAVDTGFSRQGVLTQAVPLLSDEYADPIKARQAYDRMVERVTALPAVEAAAGVLLRPLSGPNGFDAPFTIEGRPAEEQAAYPLLNLEAVTPDYFRAIGIPIHEGRHFARSDDADAPGVVVVSRALAEAHWPGESPVGKRLKWGGPESQSPWLEIVGVAGDARYRRMEEVSLDVYVPHTQTTWSLNHLVVRTAGDPLAVAPSVREAIREVDPNLQPMDVATTAQMVSRAVARPRFNAVLLGVFAGLALVLGAVGLYGVLSYIVALRRKEIGIRMALGARPEQAARLALGQALRLTLVGVALGVAASLWLSRALTGLLSDVLFEVAATDVATLVTVPWLLVAVALLAAAAPALRASRVDPGVVLRAE
ncbi:MAG TPA: FtsX-like permease family protein, partial [Thermoanaerobaculia bacterium]|nr:FtsX-like permease family protein [Thermoanaerobaculia bacterium]